MPLSEPSYGQYRRAFYQCITAADAHRALGQDDKVRECVALAASILAEAPAELTEEIKRSSRESRRVRGVRRTRRDA